MTNTSPSSNTRLEIQARLDAERSLDARNRMGQYATPPAMAQDIAAAVLKYVPRGDVRFLEPAIGTGSFFEALRSKASRDHRVVRAVGVELDARFAQASREYWDGDLLEVIEGDGTDVSLLSGEQFNLVITNPPYVRHHHLDSATKVKLKDRVVAATGLEVSGLGGLYVYFLLANHAALAPGAVSAWLIPSEFMDVNYGRAVLKYLTSQVTLLQIHRYDPADSLFDDALVSSAVVVFKATPPVEDHEALFTYGGLMTTPTQSARVPVSLLAAQGKWTRFPEEAPSKDDPSQIKAKLGDLLQVKRGLATGDNSYFVMKRSRAEELGLEVKCLRPVLPPPRNLDLLVVEADRDGYPLLEDPPVLIDCAHDQEGRKKAHPRMAEYLEAGELRGVSDKYLTSKRKIWHAQEQRPVPPILSTYMGRGEDDDTPFRFIRNHSKAVATNVYLLLYPTKRFAEWLEHRPNAEVILDTIHKLLCETSGYDLRAVGRFYGGGLRKMEPRELAKLDISSWFEPNSPLPDAETMYGELFDSPQGVLSLGEDGTNS